VPNQNYLHPLTGNSAGIFGGAKAGSAAPLSRFPVTDVRLPWRGHICTEVKVLPCSNAKGGDDLPLSTVSRPLSLD